MTRDPLFLLLAGIVGTWFRSDVGLVPRGSKEVVSIPVTTCYKVGWASAAANELGIARSYHLNWRPVGLWLVSHIPEGLRPVLHPPKRLRWAPEIPIDCVDVDGYRVRYIKAGQGPNLAQPDAAAKSP